MAFIHKYHKSIIYPDTSFTISGISYYQDNIKDIEYESFLYTRFENDNEFDNTAIAIYYNNKKIGYIPIKFKYLFPEDNMSLKIIHFGKINNIWGIRVIPITYWKDEYIDFRFTHNNV